jgi:hypothetical protein
MHRTSYLLALLLILPSCTNHNSDGTRWYKGNLHTHSLWSDGNDFPESICDWYREHNYDFLAISDHNTLAEGEKWMKIGELRKRGSITALNLYLDKYKQTAQTRGNREDGTFEVRLTTFKDYKAMTERPGNFLVIQSEELTDKFEVPAPRTRAATRATTRPTSRRASTTLPIHMNATNIQEPIKPQGGKSVREVLANNIKAVIDQSRRTGQPILPHINHPNFGYALTAADLASVVDEHFFEIYNGHPGVNQLGDARHIPIERMWDVANTIRMTQLGAPPLMGLGTDDSHHYQEPVISPARSTSGRGWIMVRSKALTPESLIAAIQAGDFYASSGVFLENVQFNAATRTISIKIKSDGNATFMTQFIGTPKGVTDVNSDQVGMTFSTVSGRNPTYTLTGNELYVRALITSSKPPVNPSLKDQKKQAWTQPVVADAQPRVAKSDPL